MSLKKQKNHTSWRERCASARLRSTCCSGRWVVRQHPGFQWPTGWLEKHFKIGDPYKLYINKSSFATKNWERGDKPNIIWLGQIQEIRHKKPGRCCIATSTDSPYKCTTGSSSHQTSSLPTRHQIQLATQLHLLHVHFPELGGRLFSWRAPKAPSIQHHQSRILWLINQPPPYAPQPEKK